VVRFLLAEMVRGSPTSVGWASDRVRRVPAAAHTLSYYGTGPPNTHPCYDSLMVRCLAAICLIAALSTSSGAVQMTLDERAITEAISIGQSRIDRERVRFHQQYRLTVKRVPVDWVDVITPFHRIVLAAEAKARAGNRLFAQREARAALNEAPGQITLVLELTFHPLNNFIGVPDYEIALLGAKGDRVQPDRVDRYPRSQPRVDTLTPELPIPGAAPVLSRGEPLLGGTLVVPFSATRLDPLGRYTVLVAEKGAELVRVPIDLAGLR